MDAHQLIRDARKRLRSPDSDGALRRIARFLTEPTGVGKLKASGTLVWATAAQANSLLFGRGSQDHPALIVYSYDPAFDARPEGLMEIAANVFKLKKTRPADPELGKVAALMTNEYSSPAQHRLPLALTGGAEAYLTASLIHRRHLPTRRLSQSLFPFLIHREKPGMCMVLPLRFWPPPLVSFWLENQG